MVLRALAIVLAAALLITGCAPKPVSNPPAAPPPPSQPPPAPSAPTPAPSPPASAPASDPAVVVGRTIDSTTASVGKFPRDSFDPQAVVQQVGTDPTALFTWVRDSTHFVPYRGSLRGPVGVLMDRLGNSLDRALLLAELYRLAGIPTRLAHATLGTVQVNAALAAVRLPPVPTGPPRDELLGDVERFAQAAGLDVAEARAQVQATWDRVRPMAAEARSRSRSQAESLAKVVGAPAVPGAASTQAAADHWWVQWSRDGQWMDADPTMPDAKPGTAFTAPVETMSVEDLPAAVFHQLTIRVIIEQSTDAAAAEHVVVARSLRPSAHIGERIAVLHAPLQWPADVFAGSDWPAALRSALTDVREWLPIVQIGDAQSYEEAFSITGDASRPILGPGAGPGSLFSVVTKKLTTESTGKTPDGRLTAEWIEYEIRAPGSPPVIERREVFDLLGPAARRARRTIPPWDDAKKTAVGLILLGETEVLPLVGDVSVEFTTSLTARGLAAQRATLVQLAGVGDSAALGSLPKPAAGPLTPSLYPLALARRAWSPVRDDVYLDAVNILSAHTGYALSGQGELSVRTRFDLVTTGIGVRPGAEAFRIRIEQGVADTNVEAWLARGPRPALIENAADVFAAATDQGIEWIRVRGVSDPAWRSTALPADARARIEADLAAGAIVVVPRRPVTLNGRSVVAWWRVDPRSGQTLGLDATGAGGAASEEAVLIRNMSLLATGVSVFFCTLAFGRVSKISYAAGLGICLVTWGGVGTAAAFAGTIRALAAIILHIINVLYLDRVIRSAGP